MTDTNLPPRPPPLPRGVSADDMLALVQRQLAATCVMNQRLMDQCRAWESYTAVLEQRLAALTADTPGSAGAATL